jgi:DNA-binding CsgD family transcriptional regulator
MVATGMKYKEIAGLMTMSESNLIKTLMSLRQKYHVRNNMALISHLKERGKI